MVDMLYVHLDNTCNAVLSKGIVHDDFSYSIERKPQNLLLLVPDTTEGNYERHTGLKTIQGEDAVTEYFELLRKRRTTPIKWIDFAELSMLQQLTPIEISELLYFGHMRTHLHSPFFYKLQNDFVFFETAHDISKIYFRHMDDFYKILGDKMRRVLMEQINEKKTFFRRAITVEDVPETLLLELKPFLQEGVVFQFVQTNSDNKQYAIPVYLAEDRYRNISTTRYEDEQLLANIIYDTGTKSWHLEKKENIEDWPFRHPIVN